MNLANNIEQSRTHKNQHYSERDNNNNTNIYKVQCTVSPSVSWHNAGFTGDGAWAHSAANASRDKPWPHYGTWNMSPLEGESDEPYQLKLSVKFIGLVYVYQ